ncbi:MAG: hypothetical protein HY927_06365 [Elusimicrobia bacterium]|nr:hypothetical protein [Elusimicrobiota bacterium]
MTGKGARGPLVRLLVLLIGLHSCALGLLMLFKPGLMTRLLGFPGGIPVFFPSQSGIFLLILGACYLRALSESSYLCVIVGSKAAAVLFLVAHAAFLGAPPTVWLAAAGDGGMLAVLVAAWRWESLRPAPPVAASDRP